MDLFSFDESTLLSLSSQDLSYLGPDVAFYMRIKNRYLSIEKFYSKYCLKTEEGHRLSYEKFAGDCEAVLTRLDQNNLIPDSYVREFVKKWPLKLADHARYLFPGILWLSDKEHLRCDRGFIEFYLKECQDKLRLARCSEMKRRLELVFRELVIEKGFYCILNTLTVRPSDYNNVFKSGLGWSRYIEQCDYLFARASFGSVRKARLVKRAGEVYHEYFAVIESGERTGRLHIHVLHFFRDLPDVFMDPNVYQGSNPKFREVEYMRKLWPYGFSSPVAVRISQDDAYGKRGQWRWPVVKDIDGLYKPIVIRSKVSVVNYVVKYLVKRYEDIDNREVLPWRVRMTRNLGSRPLQKICSQMSLSQKELLIKSQKKVMVQDKRLPMVLMRKLMLRSCGSILLKYSRIIVAEVLRMWRGLPGLMERLRILMKTIEGPSGLKFGSFRIEFLRCKDVFDIAVPSIGGVTL